MGYMDKIQNSLRATPAFLRKNWFVFFATATYLFFTIYHMGVGPTIFDCGNALNGLGDNSAGPIWKAANAGDAPIGGYSNATNYPSGELLSSPIDAVVAGQSLLLWTTAKVAGPVCGYNIANMLGYLSSALVMFAFVYSLTRGRRWIALLAGYAVAFTPFFQAKVGGHPSYGFQALLIGIMWTFFSLITTRKKSRAVLLAVLIAICFYFDPYFSLMAATIVGPLVLTWLGMGLMGLKKGRIKKPLFISQLKVLSLSFALLAVLIAPILFVMTTQSSQINSAVAGTRDNILQEARTYSNMPSEYFLPYPHSPLLEAFGSFEPQVRSSLFVFSTGNISEDSVGLGWVALLIFGLFIVIASWEKLRNKRLQLTKLIRYDPRLVMYGSAAVAVTAIIIALPPVHVFGVPLPSYILLELTNTWRVISREYVVVNIALIVSFVVALVYFDYSLRLKRVAKGIMYGLMFLIFFVQYQTYSPFQGMEHANFNYRNAPEGYSWLKDQTDIKAIAEYPIERATEADSHGYYLSMQLVHKKALLNSATSNTPQESIRTSIKNLADPQTVPVLRSLGINAIVIHGVEPADIEKIPGLQIIYKGMHSADAGMPGSPAITKDIFVVARITGLTPSSDTSVQFLNNLPRNNLIQTSAVAWQYEVPTGSKLALKKLPSSGVPVTPTTFVADNVCFKAKMAAPGDIGQLILKNDKGVKVSFPLSDQYGDVKITAAIDETITLESNNGHNMRITSIGCHQ
jgi:hypothetical protein